MEKVFKFVKGGWLLVVILSLGFSIYTFFKTGYNKDVGLSLIFAAFGCVMYYLNVRRVKMFEKDTTKKRK